MINFIKLFIVIVIFLIVYLSYVFYNNYKNSRVEDEIVNKLQPENFENKDKIPVKTQEKNLLMTIQKGSSKHNVELKSPSRPYRQMVKNCNCLVEHT